MKLSWEQELIELFNSAPIVKNFGMSLSFDEEQHAHVVLPYNPNLDQKGYMVGSLRRYWIRLGGSQ